MAGNPPRRGGFSFPPPPPPPPPPTTASGGDFNAHGGSGRGGFQGRGWGRGDGGGARARGGRGRGDGFRGGFSRGPSPRGGSNGSHRGYGHGGPGPSFGLGGSQHSNGAHTSGQAGFTMPGHLGYSGYSQDRMQPGAQQGPGANANLNLAMGLMAAAQNLMGMNNFNQPSVHYNQMHGGIHGAQQPPPPSQPMRNHSNRQSRPKVPAAPEVPSFNSDLSFLKRPTPSSPLNRGDGQPSKRPRMQQRNRPTPGNALGLTPAADRDASDSEDDEDEETQLAAQLSKAGGALRFEHNDTTYSLDSVDAIQQFVAERKKHWPTMGRVLERKKNYVQLSQEARDIHRKILAKRYPRQDAHAGRYHSSWTPAATREPSATNESSKRLSKTRDEIRAESARVEGELAQMKERIGQTRDGPTSASLGEPESDSDSDAAPDVIATQKSRAQDTAEELDSREPSKSAISATVHAAAWHSRAMRRQAERLKIGVEKRGHPTLAQRMAMVEQRMEEKALLAAIEWLGGAGVLD